jgi:hypothetical protein
MPAPINRLPPVRLAYVAIAFEGEVEGPGHAAIKPQGRPSFTDFFCYCARIIMTSGINLGGTWTGLYHYRWALEPVSFVALLIDLGSRFTGSIHEYEGLISEQRILLYASVDGGREGSRVTFHKTYDGTGGWKHTVRYDGVLNGNATEIAGEWFVREATGAFIMRRAGAVEEAEIRKAVEPVDVG